MKLLNKDRPVITTGFSVVFSIALSFSLAFLYGCNSTPINSDAPAIDVKEPIASMESLVIFGSNKTLITRVSIEGNSLILGSIEVKNWPLPQAPCAQCEVTLSRHHHPDGPTVWLSIKAEDNSNFWIASSFQKQFKIDQWLFKHNNQQVIISDSLSNQQTIVAENIQSVIPLLSNINCSLLWANKQLLAQPNRHISADVAQFTSQFIIHCH